MRARAHQSARRRIGGLTCEGGATAARPLRITDGGPSLTGCSSLKLGNRSLHSTARISRDSTAAGFLGRSPLDRRTPAHYICMMTQSCTIERSPKRACCRSLNRILDPHLFRALADPGRLDMVIRLAGCCCACTVSEIAACCPQDVSVVSRHLAALRDAGILRVEKRGREVYYQLDHGEVASRLREIADAIEACRL